MTASQSLRQPLERQVRALERQLPPALDGEVEPLHRARVATRRLRELLPLCAPLAPHGLVSRVRHRVRRLGRSLGRVREIDVATELASELTDEGRLSGAGARYVARYLADERHRRRRRMTARFAAAPPRKALRDLADVVTAAIVEPRPDAWRLALAGRLGDRARRLSDAVVVAGAFYAPERVHEVRIAAKKLRYGLEIAGKTHKLDASPATIRLKTMQDTLGRLHDLEVLTGIIQEALLGCDPRQRWVGDLDAQRTALAGDCRLLHAEFVAAQPELIDVCEVARRAALRIWTDYGGDRAHGRVLKMSVTGTAGRAVSSGDPPP